MVCVYIQRKLTFARRISPVTSSTKVAVVSWRRFSFNVTPLQIEISGFHQLCYLCCISPSYTLQNMDLFQVFVFALHCVFSLPWRKAELESGAAMYVSCSTFFSHCQMNGAVENYWCASSFQSDFFNWFRRDVNPLPRSWPL